ncbi:MAG: hypothetical protein EPN85_02855, partial [Bacteroidetes bacterium]
VQLPMIWMRTPYDKGNTDALGAGFGMLGYVFGQQDQRGRYTSEGVYLPIQSDGWSKMPYHPYITHILDTLTPVSDSRNGNKHEDGYNSIQFILNNLTRTYDMDGDGTLDTFLVCNGSIGTMGASALGYNQYQAAAAHKIDPAQPGLKAMLPIVGTNEFFKSTGFQNGVFRDRLVTGWLQGQIFDAEDDSIPVDQQIAATQGLLTAVQNNIHSSFDYGVSDKFVAANKAIDHFSAVRYKDQFGNLLPTGYYPNSITRKGYDASRAMVGANGDGSLYGQFNRYANMEVPAYHLTGWWDIFIDGQIQTWAYMKQYLSRNYDNHKKQKIVIGPWAHQTISKKITGDMSYPDNAADLPGVDFDAFDAGSLPISKLLKSEAMSWFRYNLNYNQGLGEPKFMLAENDRWQSVLGLYYVQIPDTNFVVKYEAMLAYLNGTGGLNGIPVTVRQGSPTGTIIYGPHFPADVSASGNSLIPGLDTGKITSVPRVNFMDSVANVRAYIAGPNGDGISGNAAVGNYWLNLDTFPIQSPYVNPVKMYLHQNGAADYSAPESDEGYKIYVHDPDDPIFTIGGENMIVQLPDGAKNLAGTGNSQGQINVARFAQYTMDRPGVLQFTSDILPDTLSIVGFPVGTLYAKSNPGGVTNGPTDTDFFIRILDVYPNDSIGNRREYFVTEGCVNARARDYARNIVEHPEWDENPPYQNDNTPFTNINIGQVYEYKFKMMPIGYTFGKGHKIKILISSSNYTRYQVNPNLPINDGDFFRRKPGDGQGYTYNGNFMMPRLAVQRLAFSPQYPSNIELPIYVQGYVWTPTFTPEIVKPEVEDLLLFPNPANNEVSVYLSKKSDYTISVTNIAGQLIRHWRI